MSVYQRLNNKALKFLSPSFIFKYGFNLSPMYRRSTARIVHVSEDLHQVRIRLPISYKNRNYVNSIFGGSMFAAVDPIPMIQLMNILGNDFVVWDKSAEIFFKRPAREDLFANFTFTTNELEQIRQDVKLKHEIEIIKTTELTNKSESAVFCVVRKKIYIADKLYYSNKRKAKENM